MNRVLYDEDQHITQNKDYVVLFLDVNRRGLGMFRMFTQLPPNQPERVILSRETGMMSHDVTIMEVGRTN